MLTRDELERYNRQIIIPGFGKEGQEKLKRAKVFLAGAGGLGCTVSLYLAAAGVDTIRIVDPQTIELSNLNRQVLHWTQDIGKMKVDSAAEKLRKLNPNVKVEAIAQKITAANISELIAGFDLIVDAMDNLPTRYLLNKVALERNIPFFHGAVYGFEGRVMTVLPGQTACLKCLYRGDIPEEKIPVVGVTPAIIGCIQAAEVIKYIVGIGQLLTNKLLIYDGLTTKFTELKVRKLSDCEHCGRLVKDKK
jgi:adenylyltransferase/sulfurtransferase